ncbi:MAG: adenylyl-sulfate kinase, partial [Acidobacteria bacterium]|nr:adenylyl-sulfate kinase [Acidobacteriota bacterium]
MSRTGETIWLTGLSGAGKTTTTTAFVELLAETGERVVVVDGDDLRGGLSR